MFTLGLYLPLILVALALLVSMRSRHGVWLIAGSLVTSFPVGSWLMATADALQRPAGTEPRCGLFILAIVATWLMAVAIVFLFGVRTMVLQWLRSRPARQLPPL